MDGRRHQEPSFPGSLSLAFIDAAEVESMRQQATQSWRKQQGLDEAEEVEHLCSALLVPADANER